MTSSLQRLVSMLLMTIIFGMIATILAPAFTNSVAHAQSATNAASGVAVSPSSMTASVATPGTARIRVARATRALQRGDTLAANDFVLSDTTIVWHWTTVSPDTTLPQIGWIVRRPIAVGEVLRSPGVQAAPIVAAGASVKAIWMDGTVKLVLNGVATNNAAFGAAVGVRVDRTRRLDGVVVGPNLVRLR